MSKSKSRDFEHPLAEPQKTSKFGIFAMLAILSVIGLVIWLVVLSNQEN